METFIRSVIVALIMFALGFGLDLFTPTKQHSLDKRKIIQYNIFREV